MRGHNLAYFLREGIKSIFLHGFMSFAAICIIVACLLIIGSFSLISYNVSLAIDNAEQQNEIVAFVDDTLSDEEAKDIESSIRAVPNVQDVIFVSRDQAFEEYSTELGEDSFLLDGLEDESVLRHRYRIFLNDIELMQETADNIENVPGIDKVNASLEISEGIISVRNVVRIVSYILAVILFCISVFIISNTVKLATFNRREEIAIMKMVGATNAFIRWPFIIEGFLLGVVGGAIAFFCQWGIYDYAAVKVHEYMQILNPVEFTDVYIPVLAIFLGAGFLVGVFGSVVTIRKFLKV